MIETALAVYGLLRVFTFVISTIKGMLFVEETFEKLATSPRKDIIVQHVYMEHPNDFKWCQADQCADL